jgi:sugar lactone lactonase YvrE
MSSQLEIFLKKACRGARLQSSRLLCVKSAGIIFSTAGILQAQLIDVDFNNSGSTMSGAAVLGTAGDLWNGISVSSGSGIHLTNADGSASAVTMTFTGGGDYYVGASTPFAATSYNNLMDCYLFTGGTAQTITLSGLATNSTYNLVLYNAADYNAGASSRITYFTVNGNTQGSSWHANSSAFIAGVDYVQFASALSDGSGKLVITYSGNGSAEGDVNGFQIQTVSGQATVQTNNTAAYTWTTLAGHPPNGSADGLGGTIEFNQPEDVAVDSAGNVYVADSGNNTIRKITGQVSSTIAGVAGASGTNDGVGSAALFNFPSAVAVDSAGNLYVADQNNCTIRKLKLSGGNWTVSTIAGSGGIKGNVDGTNGAARFFGPAGITVDNATNLYVTDNDTIRKIAPSGTNWVVTTIAGLAGSTGSADGTNSAARFKNPVGVAVDNSLQTSNIYVADSGNATIREITPIGTNWLVSTIAGQVGNNHSTTDGDPGTNATFFYPNGIAVNRSGNLYVTDGYTLRSIYNPASYAQVITIAGQGHFFPTRNGPVPIQWFTVDDTGTNAQFKDASGIAVDSLGNNIYVADPADNVIRKSVNGHVTSWAGTATSTLNNSDIDGTGIAAQFQSESGIAVDSSFNVYVAEGFPGQTIRNVTTNGIVTSNAGSSGNYGTNDGTGTSALFNSPDAVIPTISGLLVADYGNNTIRQSTTGGTIGTVATVAGVAGSPGSGDGNNQTHAHFNSPIGIAVGKTTGLINSQTYNYYVADSGNNTIRRIAVAGGVAIIIGQPNWTVTTFAGLVGVATSIDGLTNAASFSYPEGIASDRAGNLYVVDGDTIDNVTLIRKITTSGAVSTIGTFGSFYNGHLGIAVDSLGNNIYVPDPKSSTIKRFTLTGANWVMSTIGGLAGNPGSNDGAGNAALFNTPTDIALDSLGNLYVADSGNHTVRMGVFAAYGANNPVPYTKPTMTGQLMVTLLPSQAGGQWRFPWEIAWHNSGETVSNLAQATYPIQFRNVPGWLQTIATNLMVNIQNNATTYITNQYYPTISTVTTNTGGTLAITINPGATPPVGAGWRFLGTSTPFYHSGSTNLVAGIYLVEFAAVTNYSKPPNLSVQVNAGQTTFLLESYSVANPKPANVAFPFPVPTNEISDVVDYPFGFNGQLQSDVGYGSGVAVEANVVLTAAHLVFNDQTLAYVSQIYWYVQQETGVFAPKPQAARGWYVLSGYASQRTNDLTSGYSPDQSSAPSRNLDVAALYFTLAANVAGGGFSGYLPSDASPNPWLTGNSLKMLVGYPVDGSTYGDASIVPGVMCQTSPLPIPLVATTDGNEPQVYTAPWFLSYPGNSGGPVYVQFNGYYYPAGVYLGTINTTGTNQSVVRAIDSSVVNLITNAEVLGDGGTNNSGGGVITIIPSQAVSASNPGYLEFQLGPPAAVAAGAGWELAGDTAYSSATNYVRAVLSTNAFTVVFSPIAGWNVPTNQSVSVQPGQIAVYSAIYTLANSLQIASPQVSGGKFQLSFQSVNGQGYTLYYNNSLSTTNWLPYTNLTGNGATIQLSVPITNSTQRFFRISQP